MKNFCNKLNESPWRGIITEVGIGLEFSSSYLRVPGASKTIQSVNCPYLDNDRPSLMRAVSLENAKRLARQNLARTTIRENEDTEHLFGLAITGAHYPDRDANVWVYIATPHWDAYMHFEVACSHSDREDVGKVVRDRVQWLMEGCMLSTGIWRQHIEDIGDSLEAHSIDVLYGPGISDVERLLLLRPGNPLAFVEGEFKRVADIVRLCPRVYPGAFNPPTKEHLAVDALFEITQRHYYKGGLSIEDMLHRMRMLGLEGKPVLLTQAPRFVDKYRLLKRYDPDEKFTFFLGADAWNKTIAHHQYPSNTWLGEHMPDAKFMIKPREGVSIDQNGVSASLKYGIVKSGGKHVNSTEVRESEHPSDHEYLTEKVAQYIKNQGLYSGQD